MPQRSLYGSQMGEVAIKRFLQNKETGEYYAGPGLWVDDVSRARRFNSLSEATRLVGTDNVPHGSCVVVITFDRGEHDLDVKLEV